MDCYAIAIWCSCYPIEHVRGNCHLRRFWEILSEVDFNIYASWNLHPALENMVGFSIPVYTHFITFLKLLRNCCFGSGN